MNYQRYSNSVKVIDDTKESSQQLLTYDGNVLHMEKKQNGNTIINTNISLDKINKYLESIGMNDYVFTEEILEQAYNILNNTNSQKITDNDNNLSQSEQILINNENLNLDTSRESNDDKSSFINLDSYKIENKTLFESDYPSDYDNDLLKNQYDILGKNLKKINNSKLYNMYCNDNTCIISDNENNIDTMENDVDIIETDLNINENNLETDENNSNTIETNLDTNENHLNYDNQEILDNRDIELESNTDRSETKQLLDISDTENLKIIIKKLKKQLLNNLSENERNIKIKNTSENNNLHVSNNNIKKSNIVNHHNELEDKKDTESPKSVNSQVMRMFQ